MQTPDQLVWFGGSEITEEHEGWRAARAIRIGVFIEEQSLPWADEFDGFDGAARHLLMRRNQDGDMVNIGTARWRVVEDDGIKTAKLERFAVRSRHRGGGIGHSLVEAVIEDAIARGMQRFMLHSQQYLVDFYRIFGFLTVGQRFIEAGIPHRRMIRDDRDEAQ